MNFNKEQIDIIKYATIFGITFGLVKGIYNAFTEPESDISVNNIIFLYNFDENNNHNHHNHHINLDLIPHNFQFP